MYAEGTVGAKGSVIKHDMTENYRKFKVAWISSAYGEVVKYGV